MKSKCCRVAVVKKYHCCYCGNTVEPEMPELEEAELREKLNEAYEYITAVGSFMATDGADWKDEIGAEMIQWVKEHKSI